MNADITLPVTSIQRFCMHDGPGLRTTVFLKGCPLRCKWCHNPEARLIEDLLLYEEKKCIGCTACSSCVSMAHVFENGVHTFNREKCIVCGMCAELCPTAALTLSSEKMTVSEIVCEIKRDEAFYGDAGGVTLSGGEPMMHGEKTVSLLKAFKRAGINTAVETSGCFDPSLIEAAVPYTDLFLWDIKDSDPKRLFENTGARLEFVEENLRAADKLGAKTVLRCIMLEGINFTRGHLEYIKKLSESLENCSGVDIIKYHPMADSKCRAAGADPSFHDKKYIPDEDKLRAASEFFAGLPAPHPRFFL